ncbi:MAG: aminoglycoside phosphotransferase family protein [Planctomycetota bacterium]
MKWYFRSADDPRDRLGNEWAFSQFAWERGCRQVPEPLACDAAAWLGLYRFVEGRALRPGEVDGEHVDQAIAFAAALNRGLSPEAVSGLPEASEVCVRLSEHVGLVEARVRRCAEVADAVARAFVDGELVPCWERVRAGVERALAEGLEDAGVAAASPSDFGFHNAIVRPDGVLVFHDFEYAGRDDAARMACDFFHQPRVPAPAALFERFVEGVGVALGLGLGLGLGEGFHKRAVALRPVYAVKWACIVLNPLTAAGARRRGFAGVGHDAGELVDRARFVLHRYPEEGG